jgi:hypothetical protein
LDRDRIFPKAIQNPLAPPGPPPSEKRPMSLKKGLVEKKKKTCETECSSNGAVHQSCESQPFLQKEAIIIGMRARSVKSESLSIPA